MRCLRKILNVRWQEKIPDTEKLQRLGSKYVETIIMQKRLRWRGHMKRMDDSCLPKTVLYSETRDGSRKQGHPLVRYSINCKRDMKLRDMNAESWEECVIQCSLWKEKLTRGAQRCEQALVQRMEVKR